MLSAILSEPTNGVIPVIADDIFSEINRVFSNPKDSGIRSFPLDLIEKSDHYLIRAALPGVLKENIEVVAEGSLISIKADEAVVENSKDQTRYLRRELGTAGQLRKVALPDNADPDSVEGSLKNGILEIKVMKKEESMPKRINISG